jgi:hypothetical protein
MRKGPSLMILLIVGIGMGPYKERGEVLFLLFQLHALPQISRKMKRKKAFTAIN